MNVENAFVNGPMEPLTKWIPDRLEPVIPSNRGFRTGAFPPVTVTGMLVLPLSPTRSFMSRTWKPAPVYINDCGDVGIGQNS